MKYQPMSGDMTTVYFVLDNSSIKTNPLHNLTVLYNLAVLDNPILAYALKY